MNNHTDYHSICRFPFIGIGNVGAVRWCAIMCCSAINWPIKWLNGDGRAYVVRMHRCRSFSSCLFFFAITWFPLALPTFENTSHFVIRAAECEDWFITFAAEETIISRSRSFHSSRSNFRSEIESHDVFLFLNFIPMRPLVSSLHFAVQSCGVIPCRALWPFRYYLVCFVGI